MTTMLAHRRCCLWLSRRSFSAAVRVESASALPTRHSRHVTPPICCSTDELQDITQEVLEIKFPQYERDHEKDLWEATDEVIQKAEFAVRGHAARIPMTRHHAMLKGAAGDASSPDQHIAHIQAIIERLEDEGKVYMGLRRQLLGAVVPFQQEESSDSSSSSSDSSDDDYSSSDDSDVEGESVVTFAGPGPTMDIWDALLDSMAVTTSSDTPTQMSSVLERVMERHVQDGGAESNTNPYTVPTILTFNAVLRGVASTPYDGDERVRDEALETAFGIYDQMRFHVDRNSATYRYMLQVVSKFLPPSRTRGNIAYGLWTHAKMNHVASREVLQALHQTNDPSNGVDFDEWMKDNTDTKEMPLKWRKLHKMRRYIRQDPTY